MGWYLFFGILFGVFLLVRRSGNKKALGAGGVPGRGILLVVSPNATRALVGGQRYEVRQMTIDVEVPGQAPYEVECRPYYPANLSGDMLPGATVEITVDKNNPASITIVGPGVGFAAAGLLAAPPPATATQAPSKR